MVASRTCRRLAQLAAAVSFAALATGYGPTAAAQTYAVRNPYVPTQSTFDRIKIRRLVTFGDSYSDPAHQAAVSDPAFLDYRNWSEHLRAEGGISLFSPFAVSGATAFNGPTGSQATNSFKMQVDRWLARGIAYAYGDLTVVYFGQNDINRLNNLDRSRQDYENGLNRLVSAGALGSNRRILLTLVHDIARNPQHQPRAENNTVIWNQHVVEIANTRPRFLAVDLNTAFNRVFEDPQRYGFTNVTTPDAARSKIDALFVDSQHFGEKGQLLISQVFKHYLTRGWDWANTINAGTETMARLNADIDAGLVFQTFSLVDTAEAGFALLPFGALARGVDLSEPPAWHADGGRLGFSQQRAADTADGGMALRYALGGGTDIALLASEYGAATSMGTDGGSESSTVASRATGMVLGHRVGGFQLSSSFIFSDDSYRRSAFDSFVGESATASFGGSSQRVGQRVAYDVETERGTLTPWAELSWLRQDVDSYRISNPYVSDLTYSADPVETTTLSLGVSGETVPIRLRALSELRLTGGVAYNHGLATDDYEIRIAEQGTGFVQRETIERDALRSVSLNLGASLEAQPGLTLSAGYAAVLPVSDGAQQEPAHQLGARLAIRF